MFTRYGFRRTGDAAAPLEIEPYPEICAHGALRATVIASAVDLVGGFAARAAAGRDAIFTSDLSIRIPRPVVPPRLLAHAQTLRAGGRLVTTAVRIEAAGALYALGETTFSRVPSRDPARDPAELVTPESFPFHPLREPLEQAVGVEALGAGRVRLALGPALRNPEGVLQGALTALLAECAALSRAGDTLGARAVVTELDLRYLAAATEGPVEARARWIGRPETGMLRVELRDAGRQERPTATAFARVAPASAAAPGEEP